MAQTGYTPILIYSSSTGGNAPAAGNLTNSTLGSELAINITDGKLFYKDNANAVQVIGWKTTPTTAGGTGLTSYTAGDTLYYASGSTLSKLTIGGSGYYMSSSGTAPQWSAPAALTKTDDTNVTLTLGGSASTALLNAASLTLGWTGTLAATRGGTGTGSYAVGDLLYASSTTALSKLAIGTAYYMLGVNAGGTAPSWQPSSTSTLTTQGDLLYASAANTLARLAKNTTATRYLANTGTSNNPAWDQINLANGVTGTLATTNGGTGVTSFTANGLVYASSTSALATNGPAYANGFIGVNVAPAAWYTSYYHGYQMGLSGSVYFDDYYENTNLAANSYGYAADAYKGLRTGWALRYVLTNGGSFVWLRSSVVVDAGTVITYNQPMTLNNSGYLLIGYTSSNGAYNLQVNSQIFATSSTIATSDGRYKENVAPISNALDLVNALNPVSFNWKKHPIHNFDVDNKTVGFIAQEVKSAWADQPFVNSIIKRNDCVIEPEERAKDGTLIKPAVTEEFLGIAEGNMVAILTKAIQELSAKVAALESKGI